MLRGPCAPGRQPRRSCPAIPLVSSLPASSANKVREPTLREGIITPLAASGRSPVSGKPISIELTLDGWPGKCLRLEKEESVPCPGKFPISTACLAFERSSKRRKSFPSETRVKRGDRVVHGNVELIEKLGRNDLCPCGSGRRFQTLLSEDWPL